MKTEDEEFDELMKRGDMFEKNNGKLTCKTCARAMLFKKSVVCGVWHSSFNINSFCDEYTTPAQLEAEREDWRQKQLADPNSLLSKLRAAKS